MDAYFIKFPDDTMFPHAFPSFSVWEPSGGMLISSLFIIPLDFDGNITALGLEKYDNDRNLTLLGRCHLTTEAYSIEACLRRWSSRMWI